MYIKNIVRDNFEDRVYTGTMSIKILIILWD